VKVHAFAPFGFGFKCLVRMSDLEYKRTNTLNGPETSARNCHYALRNSPENDSSHLLRGGSLITHMKTLCMFSQVSKRRDADVIRGPVVRPQ
jgi:hypothetical protein